MIFPSMVSITLQIYRICNTDNEYEEDFEEYILYLTNGGYKEGLLNKSFNNIGLLPKSGIKVTRENDNTRTVFSVKYNQRGPDVSKSIKDSVKAESLKYWKFFFI